MPSNQRREYLLEGWTEEEWQDRLTTVDIHRTGRATDVDAQTDILSVGVASGDQLRVLSYKWYVEDNDDVRGRLQAVHSTDGFSSIIERDYLDSTGSEEFRGDGFANPYTTVSFHADGSLTWRAVPDSGASLGAVGVTTKAGRISRVDGGNL